MKRFSPKIGDIFSVIVSETKKKYFQSIAIDSTQLDSTVIRAFKKQYVLAEDPELSEIISNDVEFYAHCSTKLGVKLGLWQFVGNIVGVGKIDHILFRDTNDYGHKLGEEPIKVSTNWYVWKVSEHSKLVGKLEGKNKTAEIGVVINPHGIVERLKTGEYNFFYPGC